MGKCIKELIHCKLNVIGRIHKQGKTRTLVCLSILVIEKLKNCERLCACAFVCVCVCVCVQASLRGLRTSRTHSCCEKARHCVFSKLFSKPPYNVYATYVQACVFNGQLVTNMASTVEEWPNSLTIPLQGCVCSSASKIHSLIVRVKL